MQQGRTRAHRLDGAVVIVTGGGSGIGRATAVALSRQGARVMVAGRRLEALRETVAMAPDVLTMAGDVSREQDAERIVEAAVAQWGHLDVLVNNAGGVSPTPLGATTSEDARALWATNVMGPTLMAQAALPHLTRSRGNIINVSSTFARRPAPGVSQYGATKAALEHLTRSWALELADRGIRVNAVAPGPTESEALARSGQTDDEIRDIKETERSQIPLGRRGEPEDVARWVVELADPAAGWVTGQVLGVDGGYGLT